MQCANLLTKRNPIHLTQAGPAQACALKESGTLDLTIPPNLHASKFGLPGSRLIHLTSRAIVLIPPQCPCLTSWTLLSHYHDSEELAPFTIHSS
eukprot:3324127-Amphidinium_carterae.1